MNQDELEEVLQSGNRHEGMNFSFLMLNEA
jgi:hypothetical protein